MSVSGKLSCSSTLLAAAGATELTGLMDTALAFGCDGLNLDCSRPDVFSLDDFSFRTSGEWVRYSVAHELQLHCISGFGMQGTGAGEAERLRRLICVAHALACPLVTVSAPAYASEAAWERVYDAAISVLREAAQCARDLDICLAIEPRAHTLAHTMDDAVDLLDDLECRNIGLVYNPGYLAAHGGEAPAQAVPMAKDFILLMQLSAQQADAVECGVFDEAVRMTRAAGYGEYVSIGAERDMALRHDKGAQVQRDLAHLRAL